MRPEERIKLAAEIFALVFPFAKPADRIINAELKARRFIGSSDRRELNRMLWAPIRNFALIKYRLTEQKKPINAATVFNESMLLLSHESMLQTNRINVPDMVKCECPEWLWEDLKNRRDELIFMRDEAKTCLRINVTKTNCYNVTKSLKTQGIDSNQCNISPLGIELSKRCNLQALEVYKKGLVEVQDEGSQILSLLCGIKQDERVVDLCAGGGGKSLAIYDLCGGRLDLTACDIAGGRLANLSERVARSGFKGIKTHVLSESYEPFLSANAQTFDVAIIDAPCSGTGTWRRAPDAKWRLTAEDIARYEALQQSILARAAKLVKNGGRLVYMTCSLREAENEAQVASFLTANPDFYLSDALPARFKELTGKELSLFLKPEEITGKGLTLLPSRCGTDGFFIAEIIKKP